MDDIAFYWQTSGYQVNFCSFPSSLLVAIMKKSED